jgi:hypothetical protein
MSTAHANRKCGRRVPAPKKEPPISRNLIDFLEARGLYQRGRRGIDFRAKKVLDRKRAA